jgi:uncharacterized RDD family membrane protein YckC
VEYEDRIQIATPEGVELELRLAGVGSRSIAAMIDETVRWVVFIAVVMVVIFWNFASDGWDIAIVVLTAFLLWFAYDVLFEVLGGGRTPGKRLSGLRVVRAGGRPVDLVSSAIRNVLRLIDFLPVLYGLGILVVMLTRNNQRLGDLAAGTLVVRERLGAGSPRPVATAVPPDAVAGWDVSAITAEEIATVRRFLERRESLARGARAELAAEIARRLRARVAGAPDDLAAEPFLELLSAAKATRSG